jgi:replicative DNA helicase
MLEEEFEEFWVEESILGAILLDTKALLQVIDKLHQGYFQKEENKKIYSIFCEMHRKGIPINIITVLEELKKAKVFADESTAKIYLTATI